MADLLLFWVERRLLVMESNDDSSPLRRQPNGFPQSSFDPGCSEKLDSHLSSESSSPIVSQPRSY